MFVLTYLINWFLIGQEGRFYKAGINLRYLLYAFWVVVYMVLFGGIQLVIYKVYSRQLQLSRSTLSRLNPPEGLD
jgi:hypothetical protein